MERKTVKCPKCSSILQVKNNGEKVKNITCPICKSPLQVLFPDDEGKTIYEGVPDDGRTIFPTIQKTESSCVLVVDRYVYEPSSLHHQRQAHRRWLLESQREEL